MHEWKNSTTKLGLKAKFSSNEVGLPAVTLTGAHDLPRAFVRCGYPLCHLLCGLMGLPFSCRSDFETLPALSASSCSASASLSGKRPACCRASAACIHCRILICCVLRKPLRCTALANCDANCQLERIRDSTTMMCKLRVGAQRAQPVHAIHSIFLFHFVKKAWMNNHFLETSYF